MMAKASMVFHAGGRTVASIGNRSPAGRRGRRVFLATQFRREPVRVTTPVACPFPARSRAAAGVMAARGERLSTQWQVTEHLRSDAVLWLAEQQHIAHSLHRQRRLRKINMRFQPSVFEQVRFEFPEDWRTAFPVWSQVADWRVDGVSRTHGFGPAFLPMTQLPIPSRTPN